MTRKGYLLATASGVAAAGAAGGAQAQPPAPPPIPVMTWTGWYAGFNAGMNWQRSADFIQIGKGSFAPTTHATGFIGGGQVGYNWQTGSIVFGWEADIDGLTGTGHSGGFTPPFGHLKGSFSNSVHWLSTVRGRVGALITPDTLLYTTGGLAIGGVNNSFNAIPAVVSKSESTTRTGWAFGGGVEHMLWNSHWTIALEGLYTDLGHSSATIKVGGDPAKTSTFSNEVALMRLKMNYRW